MKPPTVLGTTLATSIVAALATLVLAGCGDTDHPTATAPTTAPTSSAASSPSAPATPAVHVPADLTDVFPEPETRTLPPGKQATFDDGTRAGVVRRGGSFSLVVTTGGTTYRAPLAADSDTPYLLDVQLELGQAGAGWVVGHEGGDSARLAVYVVRDGHLVAAEHTSGPQLGDGFTASGGFYRTWSTASGHLYTRVPTAKDGRFRLFTWEVTGAGEGGGADDQHPQLVATEIGRVCIAEGAARYVVRHC